VVFEKKEDLFFTCNLLSGHVECFFSQIRRRLAHHCIKVRVEFKCLQGFPSLPQHKRSGSVMSNVRDHINGDLCEA
jgi:hypothetical protein